MQISRIIRFISVVLLTAAVLLIGRREVEPVDTQQPPFHLISVRETQSGITAGIAGENLMLRPGVRVVADSEESSAFPADRVRNGIAGKTEDRWSSVNDWENNDHWISAEFPEKSTVGLVRIYWERLNASAYTLEYSEDGRLWEAAASFNRPPTDSVQDIVLSEPVRTRYLRLHITDTVKEESDLSLYYQNISILELEVYEGLIDEVEIHRPAVESGLNRQLQIPAVPKGYTLKFISADYDMLVDGSGRIAHNRGPVTVELGFSLSRDNVSWELPGMKIKIPSYTPAIEGKYVQEAGEGLPDGFSVCEWSCQGGSYRLTDKTRVAVPKEHADALMPAAELFAEELGAYLGRRVETVTVFDERDNRYAINNDDIYLSFLQDYESEDELWMEEPGEEGYRINLRSTVSRATEIYGRTQQGVRWGCVSFLSLLEKSGGQLTEGTITDYPRYSVRGFGIDVGRRPVSLELLYRIVEEMSHFKMNTLLVHLNDNQIIAQSEYDGTMEGAKKLYAGFRLESSIKNKRGEGITSTDLYYTKEEFAQFIRDAKTYGVNVVPEIDTPAHSLSFTKVFPKLGLKGNPEGADQLNIEKPAARELIRNLWSEYLTGSPAVFSDTRAVHIGMDEYYGKEGAYISWLKELADYVNGLAPDKEIFVWGSLSKISADHSDISRNLRMHIWDTDWADPQQMYEEGFSIINSLSSSLYIIPGGGYDYLDTEFLENEWQPNVFQTKERTWELPSWSDRMLGACYMMWNDWHQVNGEEISEEGLFDRFAQPLPAIAQKLWGVMEDDK